jgi:molybdopterin synthase catalytic subunit
MIDVRVQSLPIDTMRQIERLEALGLAALATLTAAGGAGEEVEEIFIDHHPGLAREEMRRIAGEACARWPLGGLILVHRHGSLSALDPIAFAGVAAEAREAASAACAFLVEALATRAPFWRQHRLADGSAYWL